MNPTPDRLVELPAMWIGTGAVFLLLALMNRLRRVFATLKELNQCSNHLMALQTLYLQVRHTNEHTHERIAAAEAERALQWERTQEQVLRPLERVTEKLEAAVAVQEARAVTLDELSQRMERTRPKGG